MSCSRSSSERLQRPSSYNTANQGFVDTGWKDTVIVWPGERVKIAMTFGPHTGMYMYHCHILEHEDMTMMRNLHDHGSDDAGDVVTREWRLAISRHSSTFEPDRPRLHCFQYTFAMRGAM